MRRRRHGSGKNTQTIQPIENKLQTAQEHGERLTLTNAANIARDNLQSEKQRREDSGKWYPVESSERCKRKNCKYHSSHPSAANGCEYALICEESKIENPKYKRLYPPSEGCTLFTPAPRGWHEMRARELRQREAAEARAISIVAKQFPYLYDSDNYKDN